LLQATFAVNVLGPIALTRAVLPGMLKRKTGHIVVVSCTVTGPRGRQPGQNFGASQNEERSKSVRGLLDLSAESFDNEVAVDIHCNFPMIVEHLLPSLQWKTSQRAEVIAFLSRFVLIARLISDSWAVRCQARRGFC
jgi:NAD(P)-dependent dehydrogenase (short-subunit alcohol dehydrogenase family)